MYKTAQDFEIKVNGIRLHYRQWGEIGRMPLLLLHASGCHSHWWDGIAPELAEEYLVIAPDFRGHGDSEHSEPPDYAFDSYVADIDGLLKALGIGEFLMIGHSMGAYVGLRYAAARPAGLKAYLLADMLGEVDGEMLERGRQVSMRPAPAFATREEAEQRFRLQPPETVAAPEVIRALASEAVCQTPDGQWSYKFDRRALNHPPVSSWELLPEIECPVHVVCGELSPLMPPANAEKAAKGLRYGEWSVIPGAYHNLMLDKPDEFVRTVRNFFSSVTG